MLCLCSVRLELSVIYGFPFSYLMFLCNCFYHIRVSHLTEELHSILEQNKSIWTSVTMWTCEGYLMFWPVFAPVPSASKVLHRVSELWTLRLCFLSPHPSLMGAVQLLLLLLAELDWVRGLQRTRPAQASIMHVFWRPPRDRARFLRGALKMLLDRIMYRNLLKIEKVVGQNSLLQLRASRVLGQLLTSI